MRPCGQPQAATAMPIANCFKPNWQSQRETARRSRCGPASGDGASSEPTRRRRVLAGRRRRAGAGVTWAPVRPAKVQEGHPDRAGQGPEEGEKQRTRAEAGISRMLEIRHPLHDLSERPLPCRGVLQMVLSRMAGGDRHQSVQVAGKTGSPSQARRQRR